MFPRAVVHHLGVSYSDHDPILLDMVPSNHPQCRRRRIQHFEEKWVTHPDCENIIQESWSQAQPRGSPIYPLFEKIKKYRSDLIACSRQTFGNARTMLDAKHGELAALVREGYG